MTEKKTKLIKLFLIVLFASSCLVLTISYFGTGFSYSAILEVMFWVGGGVLVVGGSLFFPYNPYEGQTVVSATLLKDNKVGKGLERSNKETIARFKKGLAMALPGILLIFFSYILQ